MQVAPACPAANVPMRVRNLLKQVYAALLGTNYRKAVNLLREAADLCEEAARQQEEEMRRANTNRWERP